MERIDTNPNSAHPSQQQISSLLEHYNAGRFGDAEALAISITQLFPEEQFVWKVLGAVLRQTGRSLEAVNANKKAVELDPQDADAHNNLGVTLQDLGRLSEAEVSYSHAIALEPGFAEAHCNLGITLHTLQQPGRLEEAEESLRHAIALKPEFAEAHCNLGITLQELGRFEEAEVSFRQAIALNSNYPEAHSNLGITLNSMGLKERALEHFEINLQLVRGLNPINLHHDSFIKISKAKIDHDIEQFEYLATSGCDSKKFKDLADRFKTVSSEINYKSETDILTLSNKHQSFLRDTYNRPLHILDAPVLNDSAIGKTLDVSKITEDYFEHEFGLTYFDEFLSSAALESLREFLLGSTIWFDFFHDGGYVGAYLTEGLACPLVLQIAEDLRNKLPKIFKNHHLTQLWAYKYDSRAFGINNSFKGINVHADFAAVNVNFWITPKSANLDPSSGGLIVYNTEAPLEWDFKTYNNNEEKIRAEIEKCDQKKTIIPYNENRVVIFNSNLFHETDKIEFSEGYENRRINITMLFGRREL